jgi:hypothetical protein
LHASFLANALNIGSTYLFWTTNKIL